MRPSSNYRTFSPPLVTKRIPSYRAYQNSQQFFDLPKLTAEEFELSKNWNCRDSNYRESTVYISGCQPIIRRYRKFSVSPDD